MPFPSPPWHLQGTMWLSLFRVGSGGPRPAGVYGAAFVDYREGSVLTYRELLVARLVRDGIVPRVTITDIWVDSVPSRDGGRSLWAIPKALADLDLVDRGVGPAAKTSWKAEIGGAETASAEFTGGRGNPFRVPIRLTTSQRRDAGRTVVTTVSGSARSLPCLGKWEFADGGPLSWLRGRRPMPSFRLSDFRLSFGG